ncbi:MAG: acyl-CoA synthetase [Proteobacteria bacterium]|nr:acyl-CoA synthetase [Pseudomonadota bacterium]
MPGQNDPRNAKLYEDGLQRVAANHAPLTPLTQLSRVAGTWPDKTAIIHGPDRITYARFYERARRLASALAARGIGLGDTVSVMAPNTPPMLEAHFGVPMAGAVLNALNTRLDATTLAFILEHAEAKALITDRAYSPVIKEALARTKARPFVIDIDDPLAEGEGELLGATDYESFIAGGDPDFAWRMPEDEWQAIALNYTSGTTGNPKGVVFSHRGTALNAMGQVIAFGLDARTRYLWTLPMFHCNGWCYTWGVTAAGGTHVCLRKVEPAPIFASIGEHRVNRLCGAPVVLNMLIHAPGAADIRFDHEVRVATGGAAPPSPVIAKMNAMGFDVLHLYGLTESYGPATICAWQEEWDDLGHDDQARMMALQGVPYPTLQDVMVAEPETMAPVPSNGRELGELMLRGNTIMKGYIKNPAATDAAFRGGWFHTGDLAVRHPNGYVEIKDRSKDIIISGGENISSLEVEEVLYSHPAIVEAAVVARSHEHWGETPCAFVTAKEGAGLSEAAVIEYCRAKMAHFKAPRTVVFGPLPKTSTGKIQKFVLRERAEMLDSLQPDAPE